ncbi:hypothetical protein ACPB9E_28655 [Streptomyces exfoliatus]|uniref:hypothetical protein n=1 Tax=Streptomyces exfoliatus TaxID=1905 RepID=UPI003C2AC793
MYVRTIYTMGDPVTLGEAVDGLGTEGRKLPAEQPGCRGTGCSLALDRIVAVPDPAARS